MRAQHRLVPPIGLQGDGVHDTAVEVPLVEAAMLLLHQTDPGRFYE